MKTPICAWCGETLDWSEPWFEREWIDGEVVVGVGPVEHRVYFCDTGDGLSNCGKSISKIATWYVNGILGTDHPLIWYVEQLKGTDLNA